jgi:hypothetical protein
MIITIILINPTNRENRKRQEKPPKIRFTSNFESLTVLHKDLHKIISNIIVFHLIRIENNQFRAKISLTKDKILKNPSLIKNQVFQI